MKEINNIKFYKSTADVFTSDGCIMFSWDGMQTNEEVMDAWDNFFNDNEISNTSKKVWLNRCNRLYFN